MAQTLLEGVKVVRGPDWKWSDQDGGEGHIGVVYIDEADKNQKLLRPRMVSVEWPSGLKAQYRAGPKGSHDLRVVDSSANGVKHSGISCGEADCTIEEISGTRWQCVTCEVNLCTNCFVNETPHNAEHSTYKRYDTNEMIEPPTVSCWAGNGPQSRIKMVGMTGFYSTEVFTVLDNLVSTSFFPFRSPTNPFCVGDRVKIDPESQLNEDTVDVLNHSEDIEKALGDTGTVESVDDSEIVVNFVKKGIKLRLNPSSFIKLNKFSINQIVKIRDDDQTIREIENEFDFDSESLQNNKPQGAIGRVVGFDLENPEELFIQFDDDTIYNWLGRFSSLSSSYLEAYQTVQPIVDQELAELDAKALELFIKAVYSGDLRTAKILYNRNGINLEGRNADGQTALHVAIQQGHQEIVQWLLDTVGVDLEKSDNLNRREIHHAVTRCDPKILEQVLNFTIDMDSLGKSGETALDIAVNNEFVECARMLINDLAECNVNIQDSAGNTPLYRAVERGSSQMIEVLISSGRIDWNMCNKKGLNIFQFDLHSKSLKVIKHLLENEEKQFLFEWVSDTGLTVAHYASLCSNAEAVKMLINGAGQFLKKMLETKTVKSKLTPLLYSCSKKSSAIIEMLVDAGADLNAVDDKGNNAVILAAFSTAKNVVPKKEDSPAIFECYEDMDKKECPILLAFLVYLIRNGCDWEVANKTGKKAADILREKGYSKELIDLLDQTALKCKSLPAGPNGCMMGQKGVCGSKATYRLSCPHTTPVDVCPDCVPLAFNLHKCGCKDERMSSISKADESKKETAQAQRDGDVLKWVDDGTDRGYIEDGEGNKFVILNKRARKDGSYGYRCQFTSESGTRCPAMSRRFFSETEEDFAVVLEIQHQHSAMKKTKSAAEKRTKTTSDGSSGPSGSKQKRMSGSL